MDYTFIQGYKYLVGIPRIDSKKAVDISQQFSLSLPLAKTLVARDMSDKEAIQDFLVTSAEKDVADPALMKGAIKAVERIETAIKNGEKILIFGDYDVDGITSSSLMLMGLLPLGAQVNFYLPNRVKDGYGISNKIVKKAAENNYKVIVTVDNGITAFEPADLAKKLGVDLIITDHHRPHDKVPDAYVIVNPHQDDCQYPYKYFAGVGVAFKLISLLYTRQKKDLPGKVIELLLFGTVADVVPLTGENRYWVREGLSYINKSQSYSLQVLKENSKFAKPVLSSMDIGFSITPQINALGRLDDPRQGVQFLIGTNKQNVDHVGKVLLELNQARKDIERGITQSIIKQVETKEIDLDKENVVIASSTDWPAGVIGLVASRIVGQFGRPTLLFHITKDGIAKGSCRSIQEFNIFDALRESKDLLISFGGHSHAAGLSLKVENLPELKARLEKKVANELTEFDLKQKLTVDATAQLSDFSSKMISDMRLFEPFGHENQQPYFYVSGVVLVKRPQLLKDLHVKCLVFADGVIKPIIFFNRPELFDLLVNQADEPFDIVGQITQNYWNGSYTIEMLGIDVVHIKNT
ncbi:MAG: single-stranded-DNA-specific exonuclease RecJ [Epsilonproteobacteria bacterium]|nr:single-stranded-DNA-specific exonuclease RecJ [Campylobacterota bacterium]|tara:strand:+ start:2195 stop:3934 length:1740 start_codon:yes stop_codon:yes gene_type:complete